MGERIQTFRGRLKKTCNFCEEQVGRAETFKELEDSLKRLGHAASLLERSYKPKGVTTVRRLEILYRQRNVS